VVHARLQSCCSGCSKTAEYRVLDSKRGATIMRVSNLFKFIAHSNCAAATYFAVVSAAPFELCKIRGAPNLHGERNALTNFYFGRINHVAHAIELTTRFFHFSLIRLAWVGSEISIAPELISSLCHHGTNSRWAPSKSK
jgi:hypothetical protein